MTIEERLDQLEKRNKRLTAALTLMPVAICAVVTVAATGDKDGHFDTVVARHIYATNDAGDLVVQLGANDEGDCLVLTRSEKGKVLVQLSTRSMGGSVTTYNRNGKELVRLSATVESEGAIATFQPNGTELVDLTANDSGGLIKVTNKTGEDIATMYADEDGNGVVGAWNRKGKGRELKPGP